MTHTILMIDVETDDGSQGRVMSVEKVVHDLVLRTHSDI